MPIYQVKPKYIVCEQVTIDNLQELADWCGGRVLGISLPPSERCVELNSTSKFLQANIGDWICKEYGGYFKVYSPTGFENTFITIGS